MLPNEPKSRVTLDAGSNAGRGKCDVKHRGAVATGCWNEGGRRIAQEGQPGSVLEREKESSSGVGLCDVGWTPDFVVRIEVAANDESRESKAVDGSGE